MFLKTDKQITIKTWLRIRYKEVVKIVIFGISWANFNTVFANKMYEHCGAFRDPQLRLNGEWNQKLFFDFGASL